MKLQGSKTEANLKKAFSGESEARNKYDYFASVAKKNGFEQISEFFKNTALNEKEHAKIWFKLLNGISNDTSVNLKHAAEGENYEYSTMYAEFAEEAKAEGFHDIAEKFLQVAEVERHHEERFLKLLENIAENKVFSKPNEMVWECRNCGHLYVGENAPDECEVCVHPQSYFQVKANNY